MSSGQKNCLLLKGKILACPQKVPIDWAGIGQTFKGNEFVTFKSQAGLNSFNLTPRKWIEATNAIGMVSKAGRYGGGTFAHRDIAFEFGSWLSPEFKLYLIKEFQRLKEDENPEGDICHLTVVTLHIADMRFFYGFWDNWRMD